MKKPPKTRYSLIGRLHDPQDADAWSEFTAIYQPVIFRVCVSKGLQHADATDVTQEVLGKIVAAIEKFDLEREQKNFRGWLYRLTRNFVTDFLRKRERDPLVQFDAALALGHAMPFDASDSVEFQRSYEKQIFLIASQKVQEIVRPQTWLAFWRTEIDQIPVTEASEELGLSVGAVYVARSRVLTRIKSEVEQILSQTSGEFLGQQNSQSL